MFGIGMIVQVFQSGRRTPVERDKLKRREGGLQMEGAVR